jgi:hypothetical protein
MSGRYTPTDGCSSAAVRARMHLYMLERKATEAEIAGWLKGKLTTQRIHDFGEKYPVSYDWLLCGDLKGLWRMARGTPHEVQQPLPETPTQEVERLLATIDPRDLQGVLARVLALTQGKGGAS